MPQQQSQRFQIVILFVLVSFLKVVKVDSFQAGPSRLNFLKLYQPHKQFHYICSRYQVQSKPAVLNEKVANVEPEYDEAEEYFYDQARSGLKALVIQCRDSKGHILDPTLVSEFLMEIGACSVSIEDSKRGTSDETPVYREPPTGGATFDSSNTLQADIAEHWQERQLWDASKIVAHIPTTWNSEAVVMMIGSTFELAETPTFEVEDVLDKDWVTAVQESWQPINIGDVCIKFPWHENHKAPAGMTEIALQGGSAFGTGDHPTTRMCVNWVQDVVRQNPGNTVLDYGSGSGILGIAAMKFGAKKAVGVEIDSDAIFTAIENTKLNNVEMEFYLPEEVEGNSDGLYVVLNQLKQKYGAENLKKIDGDQTFDITVANILAGPLKKLAPVLAQLTRPGGLLGLSGIIDSQAQNIITIYSQYFDLSVAEEENGWVMITGKRLK